MGISKDTLVLGKETLLARANRLLADSGCVRVLLSGAPRQPWIGETIPDLCPEAGPVAGLISALLMIAQTNTPTHAPTIAPTIAQKHQPVIFVPIDMPLLSPALLISMLHTNADSGCRLEATPLPLVLNTTQAVLARCRVILEALDAGQSCSIRHFIAPLNIPISHTTDAQKKQLKNINTPTDWQELRCESKNIA